MSIVEKAIARAWKREGWDGRALRLALFPASAVFSAAARLRALSYRLRLRRRRRLPAAVISVGNLSVGGNAKTPTALWLAERLRARGYRVAIVSRGYGGQARRATLVGATQSPNVAAASTDVRIVGDESLVLARRFDGPVFVAARRAEAGALACELGADVLVLDDGFQHLALGRDFDLVCIRPSTPGADRVLPAGRLREPPSAIARADAVLLVGAGAERLDPAIRQRLGTIPVHRGELRAIGLVTPDGEGWRNLPMGILSARRSLGLAGLADVEPFYKTLHDWEARLEDFLEFPDHHDYTLDDWKKIAYRSRELDLVVTTEKDLVKLERFPFAKDKLVAVRVSIEVEAEDRLLDQVTAAIERRRGELGAGDQRS